MRSSVVFSLLLNVTLGRLAMAEIVPLPWWSERERDRTERVVLNDLPWGPGHCSERVRLGDHLSGFIEGKIDLPFSATWTLVFAVQNDEDARRDRGDRVRILIGPTPIERRAIGEYANDVEHQVVHQFSRPVDSFVYRFEFMSSNSVETLHQWIYGGRAYTGVPLTWWTSATPTPTPDRLCTHTRRIECVDPEAARLDECLSSSIEGRIALPEDTDWLLRFTVRADDAVERDRTDWAILQINGQRIATVVNDGGPRCITHRVSGDSFSYQFEFRSSNEVWHYHMAVLSGEAFRQDDLRFIRGDANGDGKVNIADAVCILGWLFSGTCVPPCLAATNANGDADLNISDATYLLNYLFVGTAPPRAPFPECRVMEPGPDLCLGCEFPSESCARE